MAIIGFNFSNLYKDSLLNGKKNATIVTGDKNFGVGEEVLVLLPETENMFEKGTVFKKIGTATIIFESTKRVNAVSDQEALNCGYNDRHQLKESLKKWYNTNDESVVTYIEFDLQLD